jgi:hypothetical protein
VTFFWLGKLTAVRESGQGRFGGAVQEGAWPAPVVLHERFENFSAHHVSSAILY